MSTNHPMTFILNDKSFLEQPFVKLFQPHLDNLLSRKILDTESAPRIKEISQRKYQVEHSDKLTLDIDARAIGTEELLDGFCIMYGYGFLAPNYQLDVFMQSSSNDFAYALKLVCEIWDRRIHLDWMRNYNEYERHNDSKDLEFCKLLARGQREKARQLHHSACKTGLDSPHHVSKDQYLVHLSYSSKILKEIFDDQASIAGRCFRRIRRNGNEPVCVYQNQIIINGVMIGTGPDTEMWQQETFSNILVPKHIQENAWNEWMESNTKFMKFWAETFGYFSERWKPPIPENFYHLLD